MSIHIGAKPGEVAESVLLPGDPVRAKFIADNFLEDVICYSEVRGMLGFTGVYKGQRVSVQGAGMGLPSNAIYLRELIDEYGVKNVIRVGTCGAITDKLSLGTVILPMGASTDSNINRTTFGGLDFAPVADFDLLSKAKMVALESSIKVHIGGIFSTDIYYNENLERWKVWEEHGVLATEMESSVIFTYAARAGIRAMSVLSVSDIIPSGLHQDPEDLEQSIRNCSLLALETVCRVNSSK